MAADLLKFGIRPYQLLYTNLLPHCACIDGTVSGIATME